MPEVSSLNFHKLAYISLNYYFSLMNFRRTQRFNLGGSSNISKSGTSDDHKYDNLSFDSATSDNSRSKITSTSGLERDVQPYSGGGSSMGEQFKYNISKKLRVINWIG